jgi:DNA-binding CsgD family transcriptional regulator
LVERGSSALPPTFAWRTHAAVAAHALGDTERAMAWLREEIERVGDRFAPGVRAIPLLAAGRVIGGEEGLALLARSVDLLEESPARLERAHGYVEFGAALRRAGRRVEARVHLRSGLRLAIDFGAVPLAGDARSELSASGGRFQQVSRRGPEGLTPSEDRIARLALQRLSVPEIARELVLSSKTVEWHLGNIYGKLGVHSRTELYDAWSGRLGEPALQEA